MRETSDAACLKMPGARPENCHEALCVLGDLACSMVFGHGGKNLK